MAQQIAIDWLIEKLRPYIHYPYGHSSGYDMEDVIEQAKQMEKEQIEKAWWAGHDERESNHMIYPSEDCNQYYNETYNK